MNKYRVMLILSASVREEALDGILDRIREEIAKLKGTVTKTDVMGKKLFARPMKKKESGLYVLMIMEMDPSGIDPLLGRFKLNEDVFRVQITRSEGEEGAEEEVSAPDAAEGAKDGEL